MKGFTITTTQESAIREAAWTISRFLLDDYGVGVRQSFISNALRLDCSIEGNVPSIEDCALMVTGDEQGHIDPVWAKMYPHINRLLEKSAGFPFGDTCHS